MHGNAVPGFGAMSIAGGVPAAGDDKQDGTARRSAALAAPAGERTEGKTGVHRGNATR
jgi:hypothetical protein